MSDKWFAAKPCATCPWRKSSTVGGEDIPGFNMGKMRSLQNTVPAPGDDSTDFRTIMACHGSKEGGEHACAGYLYRHGHNNLNVRLLAVKGLIDLNAVDKACAPLDLYPDFHTMLADYELVNLGGCSD